MLDYTEYVHPYEGKFIVMLRGEWNEPTVTLNGFILNRWEIRRDEGGEIYTAYVLTGESKSYQALALIDK